MKSGKILLAMLAGAAAGAAIGMLFAPDKGSDTRKKISKKTGDLANALSDQLDEKFKGLMATVTGKEKKRSHGIPVEEVKSESLN